jgi:hypothetical protein
MESEDMSSERKSLRKLSLDWLNHLMGVPFHPNVPRFHFI